VLAHHQRGPQQGFLPAPQPAQRSRGGVHRHPHPADFDHGVVQAERQHPAPNRSDHRAFPPRAAVLTCTGRAAAWACRIRALWLRASSAALASAAASLLSIGERHRWHTASASASAASAGFGSADNRRILVIMAVTCRLSARPAPLMAAFTSLGVWKATGSPRRAAARATTPETGAVPITVRTLCWLKTRSMATTSG